MVLDKWKKALRENGECGMLVRMQMHSPSMLSPHYRGRRGALPAVTRLALAATILMLLAACGSQPVRHGVSHAVARPSPIVFVDVTPADPARANDVLIRAIGLVGTPYKWGGNTPESGFDCSGLVDFVFRDMGQLKLPRTSHELAAMPVPDVRDNRLAPGDLLLFGAAQGCANVASAEPAPDSIRGCAGATDNKVDHVGIYVGQGRFVHAPNSGGTVRLDEINGWYWREHYLGARRLLR